MRTGNQVTRYLMISSSGSLADQRSQLLNFAEFEKQNLKGCFQPPIWFPQSDTDKESYLISPMHARFKHGSQTSTAIRILPGCITYIRQLS